MEVQTCARAYARCMETCHTQAFSSSSRSPPRHSLRAFFCAASLMVYRSHPSTSLHHSPALDLTHKHSQFTVAEDASALSGGGAAMPCLPDKYGLTYQHLHVKCADWNQSQTGLCTVTQDKQRSPHDQVVARGHTTPLPSSTSSDGWGCSWARSAADLTLALHNKPSQQLVLITWAVYDSFLGVGITFVNRLRVFA